MGTHWIESVRSTHTLKVSADRSVTGGAWATVWRRALERFNALSRSQHLSVRFANAAPAAANVFVATASGQIPRVRDDVNTSVAFDGSRMHGRTLLEIGDDGVEKAHVFLPAAPLINTPRGQRGVGPNVKVLIAVHELVHACGLSDRDHSSDGLFQGFPQVDYGRTPAQDRVLMGGTSRGSPTTLVLSGETAQLIQDLWADS